ncbi:V-type ATP synthase subunit D [Marinospirillum alkaliphilum]|uniref:V/A-type H+-transporting ATPase subunit D n=1 Tax=Marinospirillum alkaliphilum DSM 21637 TaxID=1122209 RepID=A0A1K1ZTP1_9GAMM|nr:V-type ATP synthase subunit D [Marinospirillum alkaliphilum]SFX77012.1 V/A-type H+-transporting ATPase subunit D [Marinospirillum alkaliphilum DSM 21637]
MSKLALNKSTLNKEGRKVKAFKKFVPALDLKRKQLLAARATTRRLLQSGEQQQQALQQQIREHLPMLSNFSGQAGQLVEIQTLDIGQTNLVGIRLPEIRTLKITARSYSLLASDHWMDHLSRLLIQATELELQQQVLNKRLELLETGLQKTTQRLNLFDKVLIPRAERNIRKIRIALSDSERAGVVTSKIAKNKRLKAGMA